jgi:hypothetical protein
VEDAMMEAYKTFVTSETQKKVHYQNESLCSKRTKNTSSEILLMGAFEHSPLYDKFMEFLLNKRNRKDGVFFLTYKPP